MIEDKTNLGFPIGMKVQFMEGFSDQGFHGGRFFGQEGHGEESMPSNSMRDFHLDRLYYSDCDGRHDFLDHNHDVSYGGLNYLDHNRNGSARFRRDFGFDFHNGKYQSQNHNFGISEFRHANLYQGLVKPSWQIKNSYCSTR